MTSQNQQPQIPSPPDQLPRHSMEIHSSWTTAQPINTNLIHPQQTDLPEQKGPGWVAPSRPMPATQYQRATSTAQMSPSSLLPAQVLSRPLPIIVPTQSFPPKRHRMRTFFIL